MWRKIEDGNLAESGNIGERIIKIAIIVDLIPCFTCIVAINGMAASLWASSFYTLTAVAII